MRKSTLVSPLHAGCTMLALADRVIKMVFDVTVGTMIVLIHVTLAERDGQRGSRPRTRQRLNY